MGKGRKNKLRKKRTNDSLILSKITSWASLVENERFHHCGAVSSSKDILEWIAAPSSSAVTGSKAPVIDLHTHSTCSDGMLSPAELVLQAVRSGVQVLALTDHDTMTGVPDAIEAANKFGLRLIPGVEISVKFNSRCIGVEEPVHILGYYSCCGPAQWMKLEEVLSRIREGRYRRVQIIINKLKSLHKPVTWERVITLAGIGVAPGRVHVARALVEAGHVESVEEAFNIYLYDGGPAYALGYEIEAEDAVHLVCETGGVAVLAHPWALKDPLSVIKQLKFAGLHAIEVYRGDGKARGFAELADAYSLVKLGGSDFHGRGNIQETKLGKVALPLLAILEFLTVSTPIWTAAIKDLLQCFAEEMFEIRSNKLVGLKYFTGPGCLQGDVSLSYLLEAGVHRAVLRLPPSLTEEERLATEEETSRLQLKFETVAEHGKTFLLVSRRAI